MKKKMPKILVICPDLPFPVRAGGQMRMASLIKGISAFAHVHVACIAPAVPEETLSWFKELGISGQCSGNGRPGALKFWCERAAPYFTGCNLRYRGQEQDFFSRVYHRIEPDLVWLETPYLVRYALAWQERVPLVVDYWGTSEGLERIYNATSGLLKVLRFWQWRIARSTEEKFARSIANIVTVSELDASYFRGISPESRVRAIPCGIIKESRDTYAVHGNESHTMIFTGDLAYGPNVDAAVFFAKEIFPIIRREFADAEVHFVGRNPTNEVIKLGAMTNVKVTGFIPDLDDAIREAVLYILPMRLGSGIRSKLFDVFPLGKTIVTTSIGAEGLELHHNQNCLIADSPEEFARACIRGLREPCLRERLRSAARNLATEVYSQSNITRLLKEAVDEFLLNR